MFQHLRPGHPRLICTDEDLARVKQSVATDPVAARCWEALRREADGILGRPPIEHVLIGPRLLDKSRTCLRRVQCCALAFRMTGEAKYRDRAVLEMLTAARFPDWNPDHFLDTAEMTHALAIGYDWLFPALSEAERRQCREAILRLGLGPGRQCYEGKARYGWWVKSEHNWNQVCNGGLGMGALALADEAPEECAFILGSALKSLPLAMKHFAPDGGWNEGPGYWDYATDYTVVFLAALDSALGDDFGLSRSPGLDRTGFFRLAFCGPVGKTFNYADAGDGVGGAPQMFWLARRFNQPVFAWDQRRHLGRPSPLDLVWYDARGRDPQAEGVLRDSLFRGVDVAFLRSSWDDPKGIFVGFKGGDNKANHSHLDLGSFVLDAAGKRWAVDLGSDDYNLPGYFEGQRFTYYRLRTESHNTLLVDGRNQDPAASARMVAFQSEDDLSFAVADLTAAYGVMDRMQRGVALLSRRAVLVQDEFAAQEPVEALWGMVTFAKVACNGASATLTQEGAVLQARVLSPAGAVFDTVSANPPPPQHQQPGACKLVVRLPARVQAATIAVLLWPGEQPFTAPALRPLDKW